MPAVWGVLVRMLAEGASASTSGPSSTTLLRGSRKYLERGYVDHVNSIVHANRGQACLGLPIRALHWLCRQHLSLAVSAEHLGWRIDSMRKVHVACTPFSIFH